MFERQKYRWPTPGKPIALKEIADVNHVDATHRANAALPESLCPGVV
jgi:hypothetical protein